MEWTWGILVVAGTIVGLGLLDQFWERRSKRRKQPWRRERR